MRLLALLLLCACNVYDEPACQQPPVGVTQCWVEVPHKSKCVCDAGAERDQ